VYNAISRSSEGDFLVTYVHPEGEENKEDIVGIIVELLLKFPDPIDVEFTEEEKAEFLRGLAE